MSTQLPVPHTFSPFFPLFLSFNKLPQTQIDFLLSEGGSDSDLFHYHRLIIPIEISFSSEGVPCCSHTLHLNANADLNRFSKSHFSLSSTPPSFHPTPLTLRHLNNQLLCSCNLSFHVGSTLMCDFNCATVQWRKVMEHAGGSIASVHW